MEYHRKDKMRPQPLMWKENNVFFLLKKLGYSYVDLSSNIFTENFATEKSKDSFGEYLLKELKQLVTSHASMGGLYIHHWTTLSGFFYKNVFSCFNKMRETTNNRIKKLNNLINEPSPKFIYTHFLPPHPPYVFDSKGGFLKIDPSKPNRENNTYGYTQAIQYMNSKMLETIDNILTKSKKPPVIILQGDHTTHYNKDDYFRILNAWYWPEGKNLLYPEISPVNNFRILFNHYFKTDFPLLKDQSFL